MAEQPPGEVGATFAFVDLSGFTALTEVHGDGHAVMLSADTLQDALATVMALVSSCAQEPLHPVVRAGAHYGPAMQGVATSSASP